jgi:hypothetical protein
MQAPSGAWVSVCSLKHSEQLQVMEVLAHFVDYIAGAPASCVLIEVAVDCNIRQDPLSKAEPTGTANQQLCKLVTIHRLHVPGNK